MQNEVLIMEISELKIHRTYCFFVLTRQGIAELMKEQKEMRASKCFKKEHMVLAGLR